MTSPYSLAAPSSIIDPVIVPPVPTQAVRPPIPRLTLESLNGLNKIILNGKRWIRMPGSTGLEMPPFEVISSSVPGVPGAVLQDVRTQARPIFIPIYCSASSDHLSYLQMMDQLRSLVDPTTGSFRLIGSTVRGEREMTVTYVSGLEGADGGDVQGQSWCKVGLNLIAHQPYAQSRVDRVLEFRSIEEDITPFMGVVGGTDAPWPGMLSSSAVIGQGMQVSIASEVPVYPVLELEGAMDSFSGELSPVVSSPDGSVTTYDQAWSVDVGVGIPEGSLLRYVTDPRIRSIRLDGDLAAGAVQLGSTLRPFYPGINTLNVVAPGSNEATRVRLRWRNLWRSLW